MYSTLKSPFYQTLGKTLRAARKVNGKSQVEVARHLGVTFQQMQKYENGTNRIPLDRLLMAADYIGIPHAVLFDGDHPAHRTFDEYVDVLQDRETLALIECWRGIRDPAEKSRIMKILRQAVAGT